MERGEGHEEMEPDKRSFLLQWNRTFYQRLSTPVAEGPTAGRQQKQDKVLSGCPLWNTVLPCSLPRAWLKLGPWQISVECKNDVFSFGLSQSKDDCVQCRVHSK